MSPSMVICPKEIFTTISNKKVRIAFFMVCYFYLVLEIKFNQDYLKKLLCLLSPKPLLNIAFNGEELYWLI
jgi:hypothetical protein